MFSPLPFHLAKTRPTGNPWGKIRRIPGASA